ncbi:MAG: VCBS repeat-containing protein [Acidobacteriota bacterium]
MPPRRRLVGAKAGALVCLALASFAFYPPGPAGDKVVLLADIEAVRAWSPHVGVRGAWNSGRLLGEGITKWETDRTRARSVFPPPAFHTSLQENRGVFGPPHVFPLGDGPVAVAIGDVNGDGRNDIVASTSWQPDRPEDRFCVFVFSHNEWGQLVGPVRYPAGKGNSIDMADLNSDGRADIAVTATNGIGVLIQDQSGGLEPMVFYPSRHQSDTNSYIVKIGDFNHDGRNDVVSTDECSNIGPKDVDIYLQNQGGTLSSAKSYRVAHWGSEDLDVGDLDHDGRDDIVISSDRPGPVSMAVLLQRSNGFQTTYYGLPRGGSPDGVAVGDVNGDSLDDMVATFGGNDGKIAVFLQETSGGLAEPTILPSYDIPQQIEIADVDLDGRKDVVVVHSGWFALGVYYHKGVSLSRYELYPAPWIQNSEPQALKVADFNDDGANDVAVVDSQVGLSLFYNQYVSIKVTEPGDGAVWPIGSSQSIRWQSRKVKGKVRLDISRNGGLSWEPICGSAANTGRKQWGVTGPESAYAKVRVCSLSSESVVGVSDGYFEISSGRESR